MTSQARKDFWDITLWPLSQILDWRFHIEMRSDSVIHEAMDTEDWSDYEADERMHDSLCNEIRRRGLNIWGGPSNDSEVQS